MNRRGNPNFREIRNCDNSKANDAIKRRADEHALFVYRSLEEDQRYRQYRDALTRMDKKVTLKAIADFLTKAQFPTPNGGIIWTGEQVRRINIRLKDLIGDDLLNLQT